MTINIKAAQLNKNDKIAETSTNNLRTPAKITAEGHSFADEMVSMPKMDSAKPEILTQNQNVEVKNQVKNSNENKSFDFISTPDFKGVLNNDKLLDRQAKHKAAEKELVDEIVLMNNTQNKNVKNSVKSEFNSAQASVAQKSDKIIDEEKTESRQFATKKENSFIEEAAVNSNKELFVDSKTNSGIESAVNLSENFEVNDIASKEPEVLTVAEGVEEEILLPAKNVTEEIFEAPEVLEQFSRPEIIIEDKVAFNNADIFDKTKVSAKTESKPEINDAEHFVSKSEFKPEVKETESLAIKAESNFETKEFEQPDVKVDLKSDISDFDRNISKMEQPKMNVSDDLNLTELVQPNKSEDVQSFVSMDVPVKKEPDLKSDNKVKTIFNKPSVEKGELKPEFENVGQVKDIADDINVKAIDVKPVIVEDIKVIKMEIANPLADLNNSLNTTKTSDIVKFIDANLTTTTSAKTSKSSSSKTSSVSKKAEEKAIKMTEADAKFFNNLVETNQQAADVKNAEQNNLLKDVETVQAAKVSKTLLNALKESQETNKSFRVDFDEDISVVLKVNKNGQISAEFLPGDEAVEQYLRTNIPLLKQKFSDEGLEYDSLSYRQSKKENNEDKQRNNNRGHKKENGYE